MSIVKDICTDLPRSLLDSTVKDIHLDQIAREMREWQVMAPSFDVTPAEEEEIIEKHPGNLRLQKREALRKWSEKQGSKATYRKLIVIFCAEGKVDVAEKVKHLLLTTERNSGSSQTPSSASVIDVFHDHLNDCYSELPDHPPSSLPWPDSSKINLRYVDLELVDVPLGGASNSPEDHKSIELRSLFTAGSSKAKRKVILIEGVAGAGKTTLSWYAIKEWAAGRLFEDIKLLIHVSLRDPEIHSATKLADLIPHHSESMRASVAEAIADIRGKKVCFWLDGCDEAPASLWESFFCRFVAGSTRAMLPNVMIVLTSRPGIISLKLSINLTGRVVLRGFHSLPHFITTCSPVSGNHLLEALDMKPELYSLCHLPLNAAILVYLYNDAFRDNLPTTRTGLFDPLVCNLIVRHMMTRTSCSHPDVGDFPENLPYDIRSSLYKVMKLAYMNIVQRKTIVDLRTMRKYGLSSIDDALGFIQVDVRFTVRGPTQQFSFIHLSLQEYLAAFHIKRMDKDQQVRAVQEIFSQNPDSPVLYFYAGLTKLDVRDVQQIFLEVLSKPSEITDIVKGIGLDKDPNDVNLANDQRRQLLCLINCLYETQNPDLFACVSLRVRSMQAQLAEKAYNFKAGDKGINVQKDTWLELSCLHLYPTDCLSIGYFTRHASGRIDNNVLLIVDLSTSLMGDMEVKALMQEMQKPASNKNVLLAITGIYVFAASLHTLSVKFTPKSCLYGLELSGGLFDNVQLAMKYVIEGYTRSCCKYLGLEGCRSKLIHHLILLLMYSSLEILHIYGSYLFERPNVMQLFSEALKYSRVRQLDLTNSSIGDDSLRLLAAAVCHKNCRLQILHIDNNPYSDDGLTYFFTQMLKCLPYVYLTLLSLDKINDEQCKLIDGINYHRENTLKLQNMKLYIDTSRYSREYNQDTCNWYFSLMNFDLAYRRPHH